MNLHLKSVRDPAKSLCGAKAKPQDIVKKAHIATCVSCLIADEENKQKLRRPVAV